MFNQKAKEVKNGNAVYVFIDAPNVWNTVNNISHELKTGGNGYFDVRDVKSLIDEEIKSLILERIKSIENPKASAFYQLHPDYPKNQKEIDRNDIIRVFIFKRR